MTHFRDPSWVCGLFVTVCVVHGVCVIASPRDLPNYIKQLWQRANNYERRIPCCSYSVFACFLSWGVCACMAEGRVECGLRVFVVHVWGVWCVWWIILTCLYWVSLYVVVYVGVCGCVYSVYFRARGYGCKRACADVNACAFVLRCPNTFTHTPSHIQTYTNKHTHAVSRERETNMYT